MFNRYHQNNSPPRAIMGRVAASGKYAIDVAGHTDFKKLQVVSPFGIDAKPREGGTVLLFPMEDGSYAVLGALGENVYAASGEVSLRAASGAYILLKNNGEVEINGMVIGADGIIK